jgi:hypothetical protein
MIVMIDANLVILIHHRVDVIKVNLIVDHDHGRLHIRSKPSIKKPESAQKRKRNEL